MQNLWKDHKNELSVEPLACVDVQDRSSALLELLVVTFKLCRAFAGDGNGDGDKQRLNDKVMKEVECGDYYTTIITEDGILYTWGGALNTKLFRRESRVDPNVSDIVRPL